MANGHTWIYLQIHNGPLCDRIRPPNRSRSTAPSKRWRRGSTPYSPRYQRRSCRTRCPKLMSLSWALTLSAASDFNLTSARHGLSWLNIHTIQRTRNSPGTVSHLSIDASSSLICFRINLARCLHNVHNNLLLFTAEVKIYIQCLYPPCTSADN